LANAPIILYQILVTSFQLNL